MPECSHCMSYKEKNTKLWATITENKKKLSAAQKQANRMGRIAFQGMELHEWNKMNSKSLDATLDSALTELAKIQKSGRERAEKAEEALAKRDKEAKTELLRAEAKGENKVLEESKERVEWYEKEANINWRDHHKGLTAHSSMCSWIERLATALTKEADALESEENK